MRTVVHEAGGRISTRYRQMLISILDLEKVTVDDVMIPHNEIVGIDLDDETEVIEEIIAASQYTRLPVYQDNIDKVVGILHLRRLANLTQRSFDKDALIYRWDHPDPRVDALQREVESFVANASAVGEDRCTIFEGAWERLHRAMDQPTPTLPVQPSRSTIPYLTEPWYC